MKMPSLLKRALALGVVAAAAAAGRGIGIGRLEVKPEAAPGRGAAARLATTRAFGPIRPSLSDDCNHVAFSYQWAIWRLPRAGGAMT
jgi:hypothetical protein